MSADRPVFIVYLQPQSGTDGVWRPTVSIDLLILTEPGLILTNGGSTIRRSSIIGPGQLPGPRERIS
jgi:hypothetical protein